MAFLDLMNFISFEGFDWKEYYKGEKEILQPRLEALGFTNVKWSPGETDSFGPLSRVCKAKTLTGKAVSFVYF